MPDATQTYKLKFYEYYSDDDCPNGCGTDLVISNRTTGNDDIIIYWYCPTCDEEWEKLLS